MAKVARILLSAFVAFALVYSWPHTPFGRMVSLFFTAWMAHDWMFGTARIERIK